MVKHLGILNAYCLILYLSYFTEGLDDCKCNDDDCVTCSNMQYQVRCAKNI